MNLRHAAALALVGWYLMIPPIIHDSVQSGAPLSSWHIFGSYDKATECRTDNVDKLNFWISNSAKGLPGRDRTLGALQYAVCVATDDPRLKGN